MRIIYDKNGDDPNRHRLPEAVSHPIDGRCGTEIRFPVSTGSHNTRARKEGIR